MYFSLEPARALATGYLEMADTILPALDMLRSSSLVASLSSPSSTLSSSQEGRLVSESSLFSILRGGGAPKVSGNV